jgi:RND family efflux transporter MFP subunit
MNRTLAITLMVVLLIAGAGAGFWMGLHHVPSSRGGDDDDSAPAAPVEKPVAQVQTIPLIRAPIEEMIAAYGSIIAQPEDVRIVSVAFESRIGRVLVTAGQHAAVGMALVEVSASPDALVALQEARNALAGAQEDLQRTQQRYNDRLATHAELAQAQLAMESAQLKLKSMTDRGVGQDQTLKSDLSGIVSKINVQEGQIVPAGGPLIELASGKQIEASLGVEPSDVASLKLGQKVELMPVGETNGKPIEGQVRVIGRRVDPTTRLTNVIVSLPTDSNLMLDMFITGRIVRASADALVVPRDAIVPQPDGRFVIFTVENNLAKEHEVTIGLENDRQTQVIANDLKPGDAVVVVNNSILEDGMKVEATTVPALPAAMPATGAATEASP